MRNHRLFVASLTPLVSLAALAGSARAADHLVGPLASGAAFQKIQPAINAAQPGDRIFVLPGTYHESLTIAKPIELIGSGSDTTFVKSIPNQLPGLVPQPLVATGIPAGARLRISGFSITAQGMSFPTTGAFAAVLVHDTQGVVELADLELPAVAFLPQPHGAALGIVTLRDAAQVVIDDVHAGSSWLPTFLATAPNTDGLHGLSVVRSSAWVNDSSFQALGGLGPSAAGVTASGAGGHGVLAIDSTVQLARVSARAGNGGGPSVATAGQGGSGLQLENSVARVHGGSSNELQGSAAAQLTIIFFPSFGLAGDGLRVDATSSVEWAPDVVITGGAASAALPAGQAIAAASGASTTALLERQPSLVMTPQQAAVGSPIAVAYNGEPGSIHVRGISIASAPAFVFPGMAGAALLDLTTVLLAPAVVIAASGEALQQTAIPNVAAFAGIAFVEQSVQVSAGGIAFAPPVVLTVGF